MFFAFLQPGFSLISPIQDRCYEELDRCFSENGNFITDKCPYLNAVLLENFRFRPVADSLPHLCIQDTNIDGNYIKKGSRVIASLLAVMHNPKDFEEPERFKPDRFLVNGRLQAYLNIWKQLGYHIIEVRWLNLSRKILKFVRFLLEIEIVWENDLLKLSTFITLLRLFINSRCHQTNRLILNLFLINFYWLHQRLKLFLPNDKKLPQKLHIDPVQE